MSEHSTARRVHNYHPLAVVETDDIGADTRIWAFAHVMAGARIGSGCNLGEGVFIESGVVIGNDVTIKNGVAVYDGVVVEDEAFLGPHCVFTNDLRPRSGRFKRSKESFLPTRIRHGATIGANATIVCGHEVGEYAMVAAGAVVTKDVPAYVVVAGVPARAVGFVCACGESLPSSLICSCGLKYRQAGRRLEAVPSVPERAPIAAATAQAK
jgi:UDP-2-acetamido-3-amino-2,3-dideoxy-glucuronate N-acetyltransferase